MIIAPDRAVCGMQRLQQTPFVYPFYWASFTVRGNLRGTPESIRRQGVFI